MRGIWRAMEHAGPPARHDRAVAFCCDGGYLPFAAMAASQIAAAHPDRDFDICLCSDGPLPVPDALPGHPRPVTIHTTGRFADLRLDARRTQAAYLRLALPGTIGRDYRRILYLDSDMFFRHGDIPALLGADLGGRAIAAVRDNTQWRRPRRRPEQFRRMDWPTAPYFNSGTLLIDTDAFRAADLTDRCVAFGRQHRDRLIGHDQTLLNCVLRGDWAELHPTWNWQYTWSSRLFATTEDARILHFIGPAKPWRDPRGEMPAGLARHYADFLSRHFADRPVPAVPGPLSDPRRLRKSLLKHAIAVRPMSRFLKRFAGPHDVIVPAGSR